MTKLLRANFSRLWKTKSFWVCMILMIAFPVLNMFSEWDMNDHTIVDMRNDILQNGSEVMFFSAIFTALYLGADYKGGAIRNKMIMEISRAQIYFSNLITVSAVGLIYFAAQITVNFGLGYALGGRITEPFNPLLFDILIDLCAETAMCSIFTMIGMMISSKSKIVAATILTMVVTTYGSFGLIGMLDEPELRYKPEIDDYGNYHGTTEETEPNPRYLKPGLKRGFVTAVCNILPTAQELQIEEQHDISGKNFLPLCSLGVLAATTAAGVAVFRRKDLK